jgi:hypothetical protein
LLPHERSTGVLGGFYLPAIFTIIGMSYFPAYTSWRRREPAATLKGQSLLLLYFKLLEIFINFEVKGLSKADMGSAYSRAVSDGLHSGKKYGVVLKVPSHQIRSA